MRGVVAAKSEAVRRQLIVSISEVGHDDVGYSYDSKENRDSKSGQSAPDRLFQCLSPHGIFGMPMAFGSVALGL